MPREDLTTVETNRSSWIHDCTRLAAFSLLFALPVMAAEDPWTKVRALESGTELRVTKKGAKQPLLLKMDDATVDTLLAVSRNEQVSIPKDQIEQIDYRPKAGARKMVRETKTTTEDPNRRAPLPAGPHPANVPGSSTSSNVIFGSKPDFETIYRRPVSPRPVQ